MLNTRWISTISGVKDNRIKHSYVSFAKRKPKIGKMIEIYSEFLKLISDYLIKGIFISILVIILIKLIAKSKIKIVKSTEIIIWNNCNLFFWSFSSYNSDFHISANRKKRFFR